MARAFFAATIFSGKGSAKFPWNWQLCCQSSGRIFNSTVKKGVENRLAIKKQHCKLQTFISLHRIECEDKLSVNFF